MKSNPKRWRVAAVEGLDLSLPCWLTVFVVCRSSWTPCTSTSRGSTSSRRRTTRPRCSTSSPRSSAPSSSSRRSSPPSRPIRTSWWEMDDLLPSLFSDFQMATRVLQRCSRFHAAVRTCCLHERMRCCGPAGDQVMLWKNSSYGSVKSDVTLWTARSHSTVIKWDNGQTGSSPTGFRMEAETFCRKPVAPLKWTVVHIRDSVW